MDKEGCCCVDAPTEVTHRTGLDAAAEGAEGEEYWVAGWLDGVRGGPSLSGSGAELISHFGGMTGCLGGRGSRRVFLRASGSGTKWLSDSMKTQYYGNMLHNISSFQLNNFESTALYSTEMEKFNRNMPVTV